LAAQRLARCHPWGGCGCDPVPAPPLPPPRFNLAAVTETTR